MNKRSFFIVGMLLLVALACSLPAGVISAPTVAPAEPVVEPAATQQPVTQLPAPVATETTVPPTVEPTSSIGPLFTFSWLRINIPAVVASGGLSDVIPGVSNGADVSPWEIAPLHEKIPLTGYALSNTFHEPQFYIYPVQDFIALDPAFADRVAALQTILAQRPADPPSVPSLPPWNAGRIFHALPAYVEFKNGAGIRFIAQYGQSFMPVNNHELFYMFQGLTADGKYWVAAVLPIQHPSLQSRPDPFPDDFDAFAANYEAYSQTIRTGLESQPLDSFTPSIQLVDAMLSSMLVGPTGP